MSDELALVRAIQAEPDDDTPRLVYADWLDEFGATDQHRARSEWIRLTCDDRRAEAQKPTGTRKRMPGEPGWLRANAHRLWPRLTERLRLSIKAGGVQLLTGTVTFRVNVGKAPAVVTLWASRGVATAASFAFARACVLAPVVMADEPFLALAIDPPYWAVERHNDGLVVRFDKFREHGLAEAWRRIEADEFIGSYGKLLRRSRTDSTARAHRLINEGIASWARSVAANPLSGFAEAAA